MGRYDNDKPDDEQYRHTEDEMSEVREVQEEQPPVSPKQAKLLASLSACSRKMLEDVKKGMHRFSKHNGKNKAEQLSERKQAGLELESYAEKGEIDRLKGQVRASVVDHDAMTRAEGGLPPVPGAQEGKEALRVAKRRRTTNSRKGRGR